ncbi:MAG TPA: protoporphyrinogen oxidase [Coleofasciculaceae cyanobacterium]
MVVAAPVGVDGAADRSHSVDVLVVGAGLTGLSTAHRLVHHPQGNGRSTLVVEAQPRVGGNIVTRSADGFLWEEGPNSFAPAPELLKLAVEVGLKDELVFADGKLPRFVYWDGRLQAIPMTPGAFWNSTLLSDRGKARLLLGAAGFVPPIIGAAVSARGGEETVREFFTRHLGSEAMERLVDPFISGVYAGDPNALSASAAFRKMAAMQAAGGGLAAGAVRTLLARRQANKNAPPIDPNLPKPKSGELGSFRTGLEALPQAVARGLGDRVKLGWRVESIARSSSGSYQVELTTPDGPQSITARSIVLATPAPVTAHLLQPLAPSATTALNAMPYPAVACVILAYPESAFAQPLRGFGNLIPRSLGIQTLGTIWASSLFAGRAPQGWAHLINFIGGAQNPTLIDKSEDEIAQIVHADVRRILLKQDVAPKVLSVKLWRRAIPQYTIGHASRLATLHQALEPLPGLFACSNYEGGVALGDCVRHGWEQADTIEQYLGDRV